MKRRTALLAVAATPALMIAQDTIAVSTRLVEVSVVVQDHKGHPVTDLSQNDFDIFENGKPQPIRFFFREGQDSLSGRQVNGGLPPGVFSNRMVSGDARSPHHTVVLFDALNTPWEFRQYAGRHLTDFLSHVPSGQPVTVLTLSPAGLRLLHKGTNVRMPMIREDALLTGLNDSAGSDQTAAERRQAERYAGDRVRLTLQALEIISLNLTGVPGRKNLLWVTEASRSS